MANILLLYHGIYGHTRKICESMQAEIVATGRPADVVAIAESAEVEFERYDVIVIGAAIRNGKHSPTVLEFIRRQQPMLESRSNAFFSVNLVARKPAKNTPATNPYVKAFLARSPWKPQLVGVFAGNLDYQRCRVTDRYIIRFIMMLTGGPTDLHTKVEFTDWVAVRHFAAQVAALPNTPRRD